MAVIPTADCKSVSRLRRVVVSPSNLNKEIRDGRIFNVVAGELISRLPSAGTQGSISPRVSVVKLIRLAVAAGTFCLPSCQYLA